MKLCSPVYITSTFALLLAIIGLTVVAVNADEINPGIASVYDKHYGYTYGEWSAKWWQWVLGIPEDTNPLTEGTGERCAIGQEGPVWFLGGLWNINEANRTCIIPSGFAIFLPIYNGECTQAEKPSADTHAKRMACVEEGNKENRLQMTATVDGVPLKNLKHYKTISPPWNVTLPENNVFGLPPGNTPGAAIGWFIMLEPLPSGSHTIEFTYTTGPEQVTGSTHIKKVNYNIMIE